VLLWRTVLRQVAQAQQQAQEMVRVQLDV